MDLMEKEKQDEISRRDVQIAYYELFTGINAKIPYIDLMTEFSYFHKSTFVAGDSHATAFNEGRRDAFRYIALQIEQGRKNKLSPESKEDEEVII